MKRIALLTSGGDAPGMNACIRSVVRCAIHTGFDVFGVYKGYEGLINGEFVEMNARSVSNILAKGGTILKTVRSREFRTEEGRKKAFEQLKANKIDGLVVIGGNGSFKGAHQFYLEYKFPVVGIPGTIDNDVCGSDYTIGCSTALNTALDAIDKIRDTVTSMERIYVVEVMGRKEPFLAIYGGLAGGAEDILFPDTEYNIDKMCEDITAGRKRGKVSWIILVSEGVATAPQVSDLVKEKTGFEVRPVVLGYIQRGGIPDAFDRILASRLGQGAIQALKDNMSDHMVGVESHKIMFVPLEMACGKDENKINLNKEIYDLTKVLAI